MVARCDDVRQVRRRGLIASDAGSPTPRLLAPRGQVDPSGPAYSAATHQVTTGSAVRLPRGTFYFHFPRKDDLLLEAVRRGETVIEARMEAASGAPLRDVLHATTEGFAAVWGGRRALLAHAGAVALRRIAEVPLERDRDPLRIGLERHVARALLNGELSSTLPAQMLADVFLLNVFAGLMAWAAQGELPLPLVMTGVIELYLRGAEGFGREAVEARG